ncbi:MAG: LEA type 2 family protein [Bacteroidales bacterium]|jgi:hypothetical protein|nr:LEA type 2 family protein [Bacteroidales bacterium]
MKKILLPLFCIILCFGCKSVRQARNLKDCSYNIVGISDIQAGSVELDGKTSYKDFSVNDVAGLSHLLMKKQLPISFTAHIAIHNPNAETAALQSLDWILVMRDKEIARGFLPHTVHIQAKEKVVLELPVQTDLSALLSTFSMQELSAMIFNFSSKKVFKDDVKLKIRPAVQVGKKYIKTPNYFTIDIPVQ